MSAFLYGVALQWKLDIRSKSLLITCYVVPLLFFAVTGGVFTSINPEAKDTLIQSMTVLGVSMGALVGLPASLAEIYGGDIKKVYKANGVPLYLGLVTTLLSAFLHLLLMSGILCILAPLLFGASLPENLPLYSLSLVVLIAVSLCVGGFLGLSVKSQAKLTMVSQLLFLPSMMLSGILFPAGLLPRFLELMGFVCPATWGYRLMTDSGFRFGNLWPMAVILAAAVALCGYMLRKLKSES